MSSMVKFLLAIELFFISLIPKAIKTLIGYEGVYINPHFILMIFILPFFLYAKIFDFSNLKKFQDIFLLILLIIFFYFLSTLIVMCIGYVDFYYPLSESLRQFLNYCVIFFPFLFIKSKYVVFALKFLVFFGFLNLCFLIYGIFSVFNIIKGPDYLTEIIKESIYAQSWTYFGFIPKFGGFFAESQMLSTFFLICYISLDLLEHKIGKRKVFSIYKLIFGISIIFLLSKSTIPAFLFYLMFKRGGKKFFIKKEFFLIFILLITFYPMVALKQEMLEIFKNKNLEEIALQYSSLGERLFHIIKVFEYMSENIIQLFFGLGPRSYGTLVSLEYPGFFNKYTNPISVFNVFADIGFIGFIVFSSFLFMILLKIKNSYIRIAYVSLLLAYLPQMAWGESIIYFYIAILMNCDRNNRYEALHRRFIL